MWNPLNSYNQAKGKWNMLTFKKSIYQYHISKRIWLILEMFGIRGAHLFLDLAKHTLLWNFFNDIIYYFNDSWFGNVIVSFSVQFTNDLDFFVSFFEDYKASFELNVKKRKQLADALYLYPIPYFLYVLLKWRFRKVS